MSVVQTVFLCKYTLAAAEEFADKAGADSRGRSSIFLRPCRRRWTSTSLSTARATPRYTSLCQEETPPSSRCASCGLNARLGPEHTAWPQWLLSLGASANSKNKTGDTPLHFVCERIESGDSLKILELLVAAGGNMRIENLDEIPCLLLAPSNMQNKGSRSPRPLLPRQLMR